MNAQADNVFDFEVSCHDNPAIVIARLSGVYRSLDEFRQAAKAIWATPGWLGQAILLDLRHVRMDVDGNLIRAFSGFLTSNQPDGLKAEALVVSQELEYGISRMLGVYRQTESTKLLVFRDFDEALARLEQIVG